MTKQQINIKLPPTLIEALRERASTEQITLTDLIQGLLEQGLGLPASKDNTLDIDLVYNRILAEVDYRISLEIYKTILGEVDNRIVLKLNDRISSSLVTPLAVFQAQMREEIQQQIDAHISKQLADAYEQISKMLHATQTSLMATQATVELRIREAIQQVAVSQEASTQEKNREPSAITPDTCTANPEANLHADAVAHDEPLPIIEAKDNSKTPKPLTLNADGLCKELGIARSTLIRWKQNDKLREKGWEQVPETGTDTSPKNPGLYRRVVR